MNYTVKIVADLASVSVRTLHHYDEIGLLKPTDLSPSGYRLYSDTDLERLQQILFFKELGFKLQEIKKILDSPGYDREQALLSHKQLLIQKKERLEKLIQSVNNTLNTIKGGITMSNKEMFAGFDESKIEEYKKEVREKYGDEIADECEQKTANYTKADWKSIQGEADAIYDEIADLMDQGPADPQIQELMGKFFQHINDNFYVCTPEVFRGLGEMYVCDERFTAFYENRKTGMATFMRDAMKIYSDNLSHS